MNKYILKTATVLFGAMMAASCTSSFDDVNTDPDNPIADDVPSTNILAYCERYASDNLFDEWFDLNESCGFSGQIAKWMYTQEGYYNFRPTVNSSSWRVCDYVTANLKTIIDKEDPASNMWAVATIFQCQIWQIKTDRWGAIPYWTTTKDNSAIKNQALQLESGITTPAYDTQEVIYKDLLVRLANAVAVLEADAKDDAIGDGDGLLGGDTEAWIKYGNALRLRIAARIANVDATLAKSTFNDVLTDGNFPVSNDDNIFFEWNSEYPEPWADYYNTRKNEYGVSELMVNTLQYVLEDPRLPVYCTPTRADGVSYVGYPVGKKATASVQQYSQIGNRFQNRSGVTGFSPWLRSCETFFEIAYAVKKGLVDLSNIDTEEFPDVNVSAMADTLYHMGIRLSLEENGIDEEDIETYIASDDVKHPTIDNIFTQWWIALYKNGQEAWSVYRMAPEDSYLFYNNKIAVDSYYPNHNCPPLCYGYPDTERNLNAENCKVYSDTEIDYFWGKKMWWDTRTSVK